MAASEIVAASAAVIGAAHTPVSLNLIAALYSGLGSIVGAAIGGFVAYRVAMLNRNADREKEMVKRAFDSAGSHMATVAFDNYVDFCEAYFRQYRAALVIIFENGPCQEARGLSRDLTNLRSEWALWITTNTDEKLEKFEQAMRDMGTNAWLAERVVQNGAVDDMWEKMYRHFAHLVGMQEWQGEILSNELAFTTLISSLRTAMGTDQFDELRQMTVSRALADFNRTQSKAKK
jgi:hypothetical protein